MTAHSIPAVLEQRGGYRGEWDVWDRLHRELPDGTTLLCGMKVPQGLSGRQIYFLVLWPDVGLAVIEVKGGAVSADGQGRWQSHRAGDTRDIGNPMEQVETVRHELHRFLDHSGYAAARARTQHVVVLPHSRLAREFDPTTCPRVQVIDRTSWTTWFRGSASWWRPARATRRWTRKQCPPSLASSSSSCSRTRWRRSASTSSERRSWLCSSSTCSTC